VFLLWLGDLLSLALLAGLGAAMLYRGATAPSVVLLVAVALLVPWATRRQIYCQHICPHGARAVLARALLINACHVRLAEMACSAGSLACAS